MNSSRVEVLPSSDTLDERSLEDARHLLLTMMIQHGSLLSITSHDVRARVCFSHFLLCRGGQIYISVSLSLSLNILIMCHVIYTTDNSIVKYLQDKKGRVRKSDLLTKTLFHNHPQKIWDFERKLKNKQTNKQTWLF